MTGGAGSQVSCTCIGLYAEHMMRVC